ncbi:phage portal protein [Vaginisenegalia massiliensis]|uniref:phage portal protein n=1 Tax=Vaginisenegalia massiliensis TaxID=2058294 RepID=UPI000F54B08E|nr:phage portal protein [Vaginisenegalia massiliensis]
MLGLKDIPWLRGFFGMEQVHSSMTYEDFKVLFGKIENNIIYQKYALELCINKLVSAILLCEFETFEKGEPNKGIYWYKLNYEPNKNTNASDFIHQLVTQMVKDPRGALVIQTDDGNLVVAKSYEVVEASLLETVYTNVVLYGEYEYNRSFLEHEVLQFQLPNKNVRKLLEQLFVEYGKLINLSAQLYVKERSLKYILSIDTVFDEVFGRVINEETGDTEADGILDDVMTNRLKGLLTGNDAVIPLEKGLSLETLNGGSSLKTSSKEYDELIDGYINKAADLFGIPRGLLKGDVADVEAMTDNFINYAVRPLAEALETEFNRKLFGYDEIKQGTKLKVNTNTIKTYNIVSAANAVDKLIASTTITPNEGRTILGLETVDDPLMNEFKETKNYQKAGTNSTEE